jgi:hypothetical protein
MLLLFLYRHATSSTASHYDDDDGHTLDINRGVGDVSSLISSDSDSDSDHSDHSSSSNNNDSDTDVSHIKQHHHTMLAANATADDDDDDATAQYNSYHSYSNAMHTASSGEHSNTYLYSDINSQHHHHQYRSSRSPVRRSTAAVASASHSPYRRRSSTSTSDNDYSVHTDTVLPDTVAIQDATNTTAQTAIATTQWHAGLLLPPSTINHNNSDATSAEHSYIQHEHQVNH